MATKRWNIDLAHSSVGFTVRHLVVSKVRGHFRKFGGSIDFDPENPAATTIEVSIDAASIDTNEDKRDAHLRSPDFFDVEQFPTLSFKSKRTEKQGDGYRVTGDLTLHGVTREVTLEAEYEGAGKDPWGGYRAGFSARTRINRKDYGLGWNQVLEAGGLLVGDKVEIALEVEALA